MPIDPSNLDTEYLGQQVDSMQQYLDDINKDRENEKAIKNQEAVIEEQTTQQEADPRNADKWGVKAVAEELKSVGLGGLQDTASSITTFPERTVNALTGEIAKERKEKGFYSCLIFTFFIYII